TDIAPNHFCPNISIHKICTGNFQSLFVKIYTHQKQWMVFKHLASKGSLFNHIKKVNEKCSIATAHVEDAFGLFFYGFVKNLNDNIVDLPEIAGVSSATSPNVHYAIYVDFCYIF